MEEKKQHWLLKCGTEKTRLKRADKLIDWITTLNKKPELFFSSSKS